MFYAFRDKARLPLTRAYGPGISRPFAVFGFFVRDRLVEYIHFHQWPCLLESLIIKARRQKCSLVIIHQRYGFGHYPAEDRIGKIKHPFSRAEIIAQVNSQRHIFGPRSFRCAFQSFQEYLRPCLPERIDALLDIADDKNIFTSADLIEDTLLKGVNVLVLIYKNIFEPAAKLFGYRIVLVQQPKHKVLQVGKIKAVRLSFRQGVTSVKPLDEFCHHFGLQTRRRCYHPLVVWVDHRKGAKFLEGFDRFFSGGLYQVGIIFGNIFRLIFKFPRGVFGDLLDTFFKVSGFYSFNTFVYLCEMIIGYLLGQVAVCKLFVKQDRIFKLRPAFLKLV